LKRYPDRAFEARVANIENGNAASAPSSLVSNVDPKAIEFAFWETIKDSANIEMYKAYLEKYPKSRCLPTNLTRPAE
jgi:hypothetical protein